MNEIGKNIGEVLAALIAAVVFSIWMPDWYCAADGESYSWFVAWFMGGLHGALAPFNWVLSFFMDNVVKLDGQSGVYGFFWWISMIASALKLVMAIISLIFIKHAK